MSLKETSELQQKMYQFIIAYVENKQKPPTLREIGRALGITSTGHIDFLLTALEKQGLIERETRESRGIKLIQRQEGIPIKGTIAAGTPIDIFPDTFESLHIDLPLHDKDVFALLVRGQSMIDAYICDGDYVIVSSQSACVNGDIIVATHILDGVSGSATLKRFFQEQGKVRLQPANSEVEPILISEDVWDREWEVQGKVIAVHRQY